MDSFLIGGRSEILVGRDLLGGDLLPDRTGRERIAVFTQPGATAVAATVERALAPVEVRRMMLPDGEAAKTLRVAEHSYEWLTDFGIGRHDTVVAVGGGTVTDLAGFVAATYLRGVEVVHIPTTLLGAVDAAIGGKTGVNLHGKNLVGAFYHPSRVLVDLAVLESLPTHLKQEGLVEALKAGLIADPVLVGLIERAGLHAELTEVVPRAVAVKARIVEQDFKEAGLRAVLNYGHTIGHAVEIAGNLPHGHAVALGMAAAGRIAEELVEFGEMARQNEALAGLGLPLQSSGIAREPVLEILARDKKRDASGIRMVLLPAIGRAVVRPVSGPTIEGGLAAIGID